MKLSLKELNQLVTEKLDSERKFNRQEDKISAMELEISTLNRERLESEVKLEDLEDLQGEIKYLKDHIVFLNKSLDERLLELTQLKPQLASLKLKTEYFEQKYGPILVEDIRLEAVTKVVQANSGSKIKQIKLVKENLGLDLRQSKDLVEEVYSKMGLDHSGNPINNDSETNILSNTNDSF
jgi:hypothetical protein